MTNDFTISIPTKSGTQTFELRKGESTYFLGANGSGKSRLCVKIENDLGINAHRISAHRALTLNPSVTKIISEEDAAQGLRAGHTAKSSDIITSRALNRWRGDDAAVSLLNDFDSLLQFLFAEQSSVAHRVLKKFQAKNLDSNSVEHTKFEKLNIIWDKLLPHRNLNITKDDIMVTVPESSESYSAKKMSDGERAIFYLIGQTLCAAENSVIIFDEPELHINESIMSSLWDALESARPDCAFVFISHDLEFISDRLGQKIVIHSYDNSSGIWDMEEVPEGTGFSEEVLTRILGSRKPILFVEGSNSNFEYAIYRNCYPEWFVIPAGGCENVLHSVVSMKKHSSLTKRIKCAGIIDADDSSDEEREKLKKYKIAVLPVSEIENLLALPNIVRSILEHEGYSHEIDQKLQKITDEIIEHLKKDDNVEKCVLRYCKRRIDRSLKKVDLEDAENVSALLESYKIKTQNIDIEKIANSRRDDINEAIDKKNIEKLMKLYDVNKGAITQIIASNTKSTKAKEFEKWLVRMLNNNSAPEIIAAFKAILPSAE